MMTDDEYFLSVSEREDLLGEEEEWYPPAVEDPRIPLSVLDPESDWPEYDSDYYVDPEEFDCG
jgi:hypothetical protein